MMMTSGSAVKYKGSVDCAVQIMKNEGFMSMMKGAGANILRGVAGAGVLAGFDSFKKLYVSWRLSSKGDVKRVRSLDILLGTMFYPVCPSKSSKVVLIPVEDFHPRTKSIKGKIWPLPHEGEFLQ